MEFPETSKISAQCPDSAPILCGKKALARGLCSKTVKGCRRRTQTLRPVPIPAAKNERGADYGYTEADLGSSCYFSNKRLKLDYHATYEDGESVPDGFSCLCYNIWGLAKSEKNKTLFTMRKPLLEKTIRDTNADIICLQEMSAFSYDQLKDFIATYKFASEVPFTAGVKERNRSVEVYFLSKYKPSSVSIYGIKGVLDYENALMVVEYPNLVIFNLYSQAGSKYSPGQEHKWIHYARCRYDILQTIYDLFLAKYKKKTCVLCGDFNFDLDGPVKEWPEKEMIQKFIRSGFVDSYRQVYPNVAKHPGYTEDTHINYMRYNQKLIEKQARYDAIFYRHPSKNIVKASKLIGLDDTCLNREDSDWFMDKFAGSKKIIDLRTCDGDRMSIHPSDHFGIFTKFGVKLEGGKRYTRKNKV
jgi:exonuclease III